MLSPRYAWAAASLLLVAAIPTLLHVYRSPPPLPPGALAAELPEELGGAGPAEPGRRKAPWVEEHFGARDFVTRVHATPSGRTLDLFAARSFDGKKLFHFPELALTYGRTATETRDAELAVGDGSYPARVLRFRGTTDVRVAAYALVYGKRGVAHPVRFYLSILPELFVGRREPMTLVYVQGDAPPEQAAALEEEARRLLASAIEALARR